MLISSLENIKNVSLIVLDFSTSFSNSGFSLYSRLISDNVACQNSVTRRFFSKSFGQIVNNYVIKWRLLAIQLQNQFALSWMQLVLMWAKIQ